MLTYEEKLDRDRNWAWYEGSLYFECRNQLRATLRRFVKELDEVTIDYALVGAVAMFFHGFRRFTQSIDVIMTHSGLNRLCEICESRGFVGCGTSNRVRDTQTGVSIVILVDGVAPRINGLDQLKIPDPNDVYIFINGLRIACLDTTITMKMNSGQASHRLKDLADVQSLVQHCRLVPDFANQLDPSLRAQYQQLWTYAQKSAADDY